MSPAAASPQAAGKPQAGKPQTGKPRVLGLVFLTVLLDIVGFSIIFPLFPAMLEHYLEAEGADSLFGRVVEQLARMAPSDGETASFGTQVLFGSLLGSLYSVLQFAFAPIWGGLSDRIGRRPTLLVTLLGTALSYVVWIFAGSFALLVVARLVGGIMAGNVSTASAVVADTSAASERAKGMGILGAGIGLGFVLGPAIGAFASRIDLAATWEGSAAYGVNPFSGAAAIAFVLALFNLLWVAARFPETLPPERRGRGESERKLNPFAALARIPFPGVKRTNWAYFFFLVAFGAIEFTLTFFCKDRFQFTPTDNGIMFVFVGLTIAFVQGGLVRRMAPRLGERKLASVGLVLTAPSFVVVAFSPTVSVLYIGLFLMAAGSAFVMPCLSSLVSRYSPEDAQGLALGTFRSLGSLSRAIGPALGGLLYWLLGSSAPYIAGTVFLGLPLMLVLGLPDPPSDEEKPEAAAEGASTA